MNILASAAARWLQIEALDEPGLFKHKFDNKHVGNTFIRSIHGGVTAGISELCAEAYVTGEIDEDVVCEAISSSVNYLRVTKAEDIFARCTITRISRRLAFVDVYCWQDDELIPVTQAQCTVRILRPGAR